MNKKELLAEAKRRYKIGSYRKGNSGNGNFRVTNIYWFNENLLMGGHSGCLYCVKDNKWSIPINSINKTYEIYY